MSRTSGHRFSEKDMRQSKIQSASQFCLFGMCPGAAPAAVTPRQVPVRPRRQRSRDNIEAGCPVGMTASEPGERHPAARPQSEAVDGLVRVGRAGGQVAAMEPDQCRQRIAIEADQAASGNTRRACEPTPEPLRGSNEIHQSSNSVLSCRFDLFEVSTQMNTNRPALASPVGEFAGVGARQRSGTWHGIGKFQGNPGKSERPVTLESPPSCGKNRRARSAFRARPESRPPLKRANILWDMRRLRSTPTKKRATQRRQ
jgi:hypothetical protein